jgi:homoserine kinase type II
MSVFTTVSRNELSAWLANFPIGDLLDFQGISAGITNTNYFVTTTQDTFVLTLFEQHSAEELPAFLHLMQHLSKAGLPCPRPIESNQGQVVTILNGKPASLVSRLHGRDIESPDVQHCYALGEFMAHMHIAAKDFNEPLPDTRDQDWFNQVWEKIHPKLDAEILALMGDTLQKIQHHDFSHLPTSVIHADLFRDNVLMQDHQIGGVIDFYYACQGICLYDLAIAVNDWCEQHGEINLEKARALLDGYHAIRPLSHEEREAWGLLLQKAALRFLLSRFHDAIFPASGELTHAKDPHYFKKILEWHLQHSDDTALIWHS